MKKITLLLLTILYSIVGYSQFPENFEGPSVTVPNGFPAGWLVTDNGVGTTTSWNIVSSTQLLINGTKSAYINRQEIGMGNISEDWLISPASIIPTNGQLRFFTRQSLPGDDGTIYQIRIYSGTSPQNTLGSYTTIKTWTETELNANYNVPEEKVVDFPSTSFGANTYVAFVRVYTQPTAAQGGDRWVIDDINVVQKCLVPGALNANNIAASQANLFWPGAVGASGYEVEVIPATGTPTGTATDAFNSTATTVNFLKTGLTQNTNYKYYVRTNCGNGNFSEWVGPFNFQTLAIGTACADPIVIPSLPYQTINNTGNFGNTLAGPQLSSCIAGGTNYQSGNDVFYSFTPTESCPVSFTLDPTQTSSSMFIYPSCAGITGPCLAAVGNTTNSVRVINLNVIANTTYIIVISSNSLSPTIGYNLLIQCENCPSKPTNLTVSNETLTGADFAWTPPTGTVLGYEIAVQPAGSAVPAGAGQYTSTTANFTPTDLNAATPYQYWVRSECAPGVFSAWSGPILFNTKICAVVDECVYIFRMTDSANNGWNGARMQIRQNGIVVATIGSNYNSGAGPVDVPVTVCDGVPFDIFWSVAGIFPQQCIVSVVNPFGQTIATINGASQTVGTSIYTGTVNCDTPLCNLAPTNVTVTNITTSSATINWVAPGTEGVGFDIYLVPAGSPVPNDTTAPTYSGTNGPAVPFFYTIAANSLLADTSYDVYVRVQCTDPGNSPWSVIKTFKTLPTCPKPIAQTVTGITTTTAVLGWTPGASETQWDVLLLAAPNAVPPAAPGITPTVGVLDRYVSGITGTAGIIQTLSATTSPALPALDPSTIYYYYVRAVCPGNDASTWTGPFIFNTITCDATEKCTYRFVLTNISNNNWNFGRMQVRQNGIVVATLGTGGVNNPFGIPVSICNNVPFDLFWSVEGNLPLEIGLTIIDVNNDIVFTKLPGVGTPLTVLYSDTILGNCLPPSCPKPTDLQVVSTTQTTANLSWTIGNTETQWEVYVVEEGGTPPVNGSVFVGGSTFPYYNASVNTNFQVTGLTPGTQYQYYVRAICTVDTDMSNWTLLTPKSFITIPANDDCGAAIPVPVNPTQICAQTVSGNTLGGTASAEISTCPGNENDDVWFSFVAESNIHIVDLLNVQGTTTNIRFAVYNGIDCGTMTQIFCSATNNNTAVLINLVVGETYKIRVYTNGSNPTQSATFDVCVSTPPPPGPNDECINAIPITVNVLSSCVYTTPGTLIGATGSTGVSNTACVGNEDDDVWFSFTASSTHNFVSLLNIEGTTTNLNHAVYSGTCDNLVLLNCAPANTLTSNSTNYVIGQTYFIRVWSNGSNSEVVTFDVCVKPVSTCDNAAPFCGASSDNPYIFPNTTGLPNSTQIACLGSIPNPTYYTLHVGQTGPLNFTMYQNTNISPTGQLLGETLDVDFVAWGPFTSTDSCDQIVFGDCPSCPFSNVGSNFYPFGNIVDCSYSGSSTETISIPNAQEGEFYILLITNFNGDPGFISLVQTNFNAPGAGETICCDVDLGADISVCADSVVLDALAGVADLNNVPAVFEWYLNDVLIEGATQSLYIATAPGTYTVKGDCGLNPVEDSIDVILSPEIIATTPENYVLCGVEFADFDLNTLTAEVLGTLDETAYTVSYYELENDAIADAANAIDLSDLFTNTVPNFQTIYVRVESNVLSTCYVIVEANLVVTAIGSAQFSYTSPSTFCKDETLNPMPIYIGGGTAGIFTATPEGLVIDATTGEINLSESTAGSYEIANTLGNVECGNVVFTTNVEIFEPTNGDFSYPETEYCSNSAPTASPVFSGTGGGSSTGIFTATPEGLSIDPTTGVIDLPASLPGIYVITYTVEASGPCAGSANTFTMSIFAPSSAVISYNSPFCNISATSELVTLVGSTGGTFISTSGLTIDGTSGAINPSTSIPGTYTVSYIVAGDGTCAPGIFTVDVVIEEPANASFIYAQTEYCIDDVSSDVPVFTGNAVAGVFTASPAGLVINSVTGLIDLSTSTEGTYLITNTVATSNSCPGDIHTFTIKLVKAANATISYNDPFCASSSTSELVTVVGSTGGTFSSTNGLSIDTNTGTINPSASNEGTYTIIYAINNNDSCGPFQTTTEVTISQEVSIDFTEGCENNLYRLVAIPFNDSFDVATSTFVWTGPTVVSTDQANAIVLGSNGVYTVKVTNSQGCSATETITVNNVSCVIQKGISPNNDGDNDVFDLSALNVKELFIYNRYGTEVYNFPNYTDQWGGQSSGGKELPDGTYFYMIHTVAGENISGWIYINR
ncbi:fibronectin type III domain-containing protein [Flavobacterium sp. SM2513]|uniref:fibronectin type III domain-containing protein n=1 Tax=Flavobacterium sp. SM2513 TaxID=3424766 RepID=UPI003D7FFA9C